MLLLKPNCECCDIDLPPDNTLAMCCSFECTFCTNCATAVFQGSCPNCNGELLRRPIRPAAELVNHPASKTRVVKDHPQCREVKS